MRFASMTCLAVLAVPTALGAQTTTAPVQTAPPPAQVAPAPAPVDAAPGPVATATVTAPQVVQPAVGVDVLDPAGTKVGTIKAMDAQFVTLATAKGEVKLPSGGVGPGPNGAVVGLTAAQLDAAVTQAATPRPAPAAAPAKRARRHR